jgi:predicted transcriptional regulator
METAIIIVLAFMLLIAVIILIDINYDIKALNIKNQACAVALDKSKKENGKLKTNNENLKITIDEQEARFNKHLKKAFDYRESNASILETKYKSSLQKINERDQKIKDLDSQIIELEKTKKEYSIRVFNLQTKIDIDKNNAIYKANKAVNLCNEMANKFKSLNLELEVIESELLRKLKS